ncbi:hypothetical protein [Paraburkholderia sp. J8-2]|uniref:hypothetical protein n=1 Tax=Paraburkholderia sp. J8-2 TaxID=2805440 RepID=UPI002AB6DCEB|nr:hypothetical protein [Paraburkholderia sp. J8-2]
MSGEQFEVAPHASPVIEVVDALAEGDTVITVFPLNGQCVAGPEVRRVVDEAGREGIEMVNADSDTRRTLADLPRLDHEQSAYQVGSMATNAREPTLKACPRLACGSII